MLFNALNHVRTYREAYPHAKLAWDDEVRFFPSPPLRLPLLIPRSLLQNPSTGPLHLTLSDPPLHLLFSPLTQRLGRIEVSGLSPGSWVSYRGRALQSEEEEGEEDVVKIVRRALGPTYGSSEGGEGGREEMLSYPGVAFGVVSSSSGAPLSPSCPWRTLGALTQPESAGSSLSRIVLTPLPAPSDVPVDQAWLHPVLPASPSAALGDLRAAEVYVRRVSSFSPSCSNLTLFPSSTARLLQPPHPHCPPLLRRRRRRSLAGRAEDRRDDE
jgi:hypothetical protein